MSTAGKKPGVRREWTDAQKTAVVEAVLDGMADGFTLQDTVRKVAQEQALKLTPGLVRTWIVAQDDWFGRYQKTKALLGQAFAEEAIQIARESTSQSTAIDRVLIETLKWAAAKANPVEYGERQTVQHEGAQTLQVKVVEENIPLRNVETQKALEAGLMLSIAAQGVTTVSGVTT
jgi:hypothetical protein